MSNEQETVDAQQQETVAADQAQYTGSILSGAFWMVLLSGLFFWLRALGQLIAGERPMAAETPQPTSLTATPARTRMSLCTGLKESPMRSSPVMNTGARSTPWARWPR